MKEFFKEIFTDAKGRPEIKNVIGVPAVACGIIVGLLGLFIIKVDYSAWSVFMGFSSGLIVTTTVADAVTDATNKGQ